MLFKSEICFPNSHIIFMHDTPSKAYLIEKPFSHGCIRLARPVETLAIEILKDDKTDRRPDIAMNKGREV
jgi:murein L,D-transpeptidase YcbB/YkuD